MDLNEELKFLRKFIKNGRGVVGSGGQGVGFRGGGGQGGCERRIEVFEKIQKKMGEGVRLVGGGGDVGYGDVNQE